LIYLDAPGTGLSVREGKLVAKIPDSEGVFEAVYLPHGRLHCIILAARGFVTTDALAWLDREHVAVFVVSDGAFLTVVSATAGRLARGELAIRQRQMACIDDPKRRLVAARNLVAAKIGTLKLEPAAQRAFIGKLARARSIEAAMIKRPRPERLTGAAGKARSWLLRTDRGSSLTQGRGVGERGDLVKRAGNFLIGSRCIRSTR
jgi:CRISPR/Cas system-associated endonuclease Cas1